MKWSEEPHRCNPNGRAYRENINYYTLASAQASTFFPFTFPEMVNCSGDILRSLEEIPTALVRNEAGVYEFVLLFPTFVLVFLWEVSTSLKSLSLI